MKALSLKPMVNDENIDIEEFTKHAQEDPEWFFKEVLGVELWSKEKEIVRSVRDNIRTAVRSGNSSGKTYTTARVALWFLYSFIPSVVIDTAPTHRQVENQFWREFRRAYKSSKMPLGGKLLKTQFNVDENWFAIGFSAKSGEDGMEKFQGWHADNILVIVDEASGVNGPVFQAIQGALAGGKTVRLIYIGNPTRATGDFADAFKDPLFHKIHISAFDIPNVIENKLVIPGLATRDWVDSMRSKYGEDSDVYRVRVLGEFPRKDNSTLIGVDLVEQAIGADRELFGTEEIIGLDPARFGDDTAEFVYRKGNKAKHLETIEKSDTMVLAGKAKNYLKEYPNAVIHIDIIGLGAGIYDRLKEQPDIAHRVFGVNSAMPATDKEEYVNLRMEGWAIAKAWLRDGILEPHEGWYELAAPRYKITSNGAMQLESKEDMKKRGVKSPNVGDAFVLTLQRPTEGAYDGFLWL